MLVLKSPWPQRFPAFGNCRFFGQCIFVRHPLNFFFFFLKKNTHRNLIGHFWEDLLKFLERAGEPLGCGQIRVRIPYPASRNVTRMAPARDGKAERSRPGLGAGAFGFLIPALSLNQQCDLGPVTSFSVPRVPCTVARIRQDKASSWFAA